MGTENTRYLFIYSLSKSANKTLVQWLEQLVRAERSRQSELMPEKRQRAVSWRNFKTQSCVCVCVRSLSSVCLCVTLSHCQELMEPVKANRRDHI